MSSSEDGTSLEATEVIPPSEKFIAATDITMMAATLLLLVVGWRIRRARRKARVSPIPEL
jgi:hypothetical protein